MAKKANKYLYGWKLYVNYGDGWEYETFNEKFRDAKEEKKLYHQNCNYPVKLSHGRESNPDYIQA